MRRLFSGRPVREQQPASLVLDLGKGRVWVEGREVGLTAKELLTIAALHERGGDLCSKDDLAKRVWPEFGGAVDDESIEQVISRLRRKIEPDPQHPRYLLTSRGLGYRLLAGTMPAERSSAPAWSRRVGLSALLAAAVIATVAGGTIFLRATEVRSQPVVPSAPMDSPGWTLIAADDFSNPDKTAFPKGAGSTLAGVIFTRGPESGEYLMRVMKGPGGSGLTTSGPLTSLDSFAFEADARVAGSLQYGLALFWGSADALHLRVDPSNGNVELFNTPEGTLTKVEHSPAVRPADDTSHLRLEVSGAQVNVLINGTAVTSVTLGSAARRPVSPGFHVFMPPGQEVTETSGTRAFFDNFRLFGKQ